MCIMFNFCWTPLLKTESFVLGSCMVALFYADRIQLCETKVGIMRKASSFYIYNVWGPTHVL